MKLNEVIKAVKEMTAKQQKIVWLSAGHRYRSNKRFDKATELTEAEANTARIYIKESREELDKIEALIFKAAPKAETPEQETSDPVEDDLQDEQKEPAKRGRKPKNQDA
jgi:hypothetical protein